MPKPSQAQEIAAATRFAWSVIAGMATVLAVVTWFAWPRPVPEEPRAREYRDFDMCLLTDSEGINGPEAARVWSELKAVSLETKVRASFLAVPGQQTQARAAQFVATQVQQRCGIIVAVGTNQIAATVAEAGKYPQLRFVTVGGTETGANLSTVDIGAVASHVRPMIPPS